MTAEEREVYDFLNGLGGRFVSTLEICQRAGTRNRYAQDKHWALPVLRRMEIQGLVESNEMGEYRARSGQTTTFRRALAEPLAGENLGETTIIMLGERRGGD